MKIETKLTHYVNYNDFEKFVQSTYNVENYEFASSEECSNDTAHTSSNVVKKPLDKWTQGDLDKFINENGNRQYMMHTLLQDMVNRDLIPEGNYVINVSW